MSKEICISSTPHETRLAILEDEQLTEVYYERENEYTLAGSIYKGRVTRVLPGMQSAFVDLGLERDAFLYVTDFMEEQEDSSDFERIPVNGRHDEPQARESQAREPQARENQNRDQRQPRAPRAPAVGQEEPRRSVAPVDSAGAAAADGSAPAGEFEDGTRRWRGRRGRRKGFRPQQGGQQAAREQAAPERVEVPQPFEPVDPIEASYDERTLPVAFSLPGESLSKYGGQSAAPAAAKPSTQPAAAKPSTQPATPPKANVVNARPSTLIEVPLDWDGSGPLPGESLSRYRSAPEGISSQNEPPAAAHLPEVEPSLPEEATVTRETAVSALHDAGPYEAVTEAAVTEHELDAPDAEEIAELNETEQEIQASMADEPLLAAAEFEPKEASASYRVDPSAPSEFRFAAPPASLLEEEFPRGSRSCGAALSRPRRTGRGRL